MRNENSDYELLTNEEREELGLLVELQRKTERRAAYLATHPVRGPEGREELSKIALVRETIRRMCEPAGAPVPA